NGPLSCGQR
nr:Chain A, Coagulation factor XII [Homo sapiens]6B77_A Chain A, Coagulation factor XII [Homo sapiens]